MSYNIADLNVAFFRHKFSGTRPEEDVRKLWNQRKVGLHWGEKYSTDPSDYDNSTAQSEIQRLNDFGERGVIIAAYYGNDYDIHSDEMLIGVVPPGSKPVGEDVGDSIFKTLSMDDEMIHVVSFKDHPVLSAVRPQGHSLCRWKAAEDQVRAVVREGQLPAEVGSLSSEQLEVACNEFLRVQFEGYFPTLPVGRTLRDVDIVGGTASERILAQVTQESDTNKLESKIQRLRNYADENARLVLFGPAEYEPKTKDSIDYIAVEEVFDTLYSDKSHGRKMLDRMLNPA
ncbi:hypothetical protein [Natronosalvus halobius]|uniref:hypothetical protein n=1 Tax=Natronosalvus halobius TaxID=2953746 RepID=UPI0020A0C978|nr:hypothetical protein [Natronosalvus halobius]USZ70513.1 hypothetical protein NGM15_10355 [Natronosalvus halobius]